MIDKYSRQLVVSTGKSDWPHDHTEEKSSLSHHLAKALESAPNSKASIPETSSLPGIYSTQRSITGDTAPAKTGLFSSSVVSQSHAADRETVLVFPDWVAVTNVENSQGGAAELIEGLDGPQGIQQAAFDKKVWALPYRAVVLLCMSRRQCGTGTGTEIACSFRRLAQAER